MSAALLTLDNVAAGYGALNVLRSVSFAIGAARVVTLLGRNGMGKSTTVKAIMGQLPLAAGHIAWAGEHVSHLPDHARARLGIALVPEGRAIFPNLTVRENLLVGHRGRRRGAQGGWSIERIHRMFPRLKERERHLGTQLSGGEQQMLAIGRALMTDPRLLILDEATEGLSPLIRGEIWKALAELKQAGLAMLVIDKNLAALAQLADWHLVMEKGALVWSGDTPALHRDKDHVRQYLGV